MTERLSQCMGQRCGIVYPRTLYAFVDTPLLYPCDGRMATFVSAAPETEEDSFAIAETFAEVGRLEALENEVSEPFKTFYEARKLLEGKKELVQNALRERLLKMAETRVATGTGDLDQLVALLDYRIGKNCFATEENQQAQVHLENAVEVLGPIDWQGKLYDDDPQKDSTTFVMHIRKQTHLPCLLDGCNQLGALWASRGDFQKSLACLNKSLLLHDTISSSCVGSIDEKEKKELDSYHIFTLFFLAQVEGQLGHSARSSEHVRETLRLQHCCGEYVAHDWALNCAKLSEYYYNIGDVREAENCLFCAQQVANELPEPSYADDGKTSLDIDDVNLSTRCRVWRFWGDLYANVLHAAKENRLSEKIGGDVHDKSYNDSTRTLICPLTLSEEKMKCRRSPKLQSIVNISVATDVFKLARACYEKALPYFVLDGRVTDHCEIQQKVGRIYRDLAAFEPDMKRKASMENRCCSLLGSLYEQLNSQVYLSLCKELCFACGQAMQEVQAMYFDAASEAGVVSERNEFMKKSDKAGFKGYTWFTKFLRLFNTLDGKHPETVDKDSLPGVLLCHLNTARILGKMYGDGNNAMKLHWTKESLKEYRFVLAFGEKDIPLALAEAKNDANLEGRNPDSVQPIFQAEMEHCREMVELLPLKIDQFRSDQ